MEFTFKSIKGKREKNEDYYGNFKDELFIVADGLGGHPAGEVASKLSVETAIGEFKQNRSERPEDVLKEIFEKANKRVFEESLENRSYRGMGTTMVALIFKESQLFVGNVGDSRAYLFSNNKLQLISKDDRDLSGRLLQALGVSERCPLVHTNTIDIESGDKALLCSDGLTDYVADNHIREILATKKAPKILTKRFVKTAIESDSLDNITAGIIDY